MALCSYGLHSYGLSQAGIGTTVQHATRGRGTVVAAEGKSSVTSVSAYAGEAIHDGKTKLRALLGWTIDEDSRLSRRAMAERLEIEIKFADGLVRIFLWLLVIAFFALILSDFKTIPAQQETRKLVFRELHLDSDEFSAIVDRHEP